MILQLKNIYKTYMQGKLDVPVLKDINLDVDAGEYVAIMGPSGSGKTTLMNIIGCLDLPTSGEYLLNGIDIALNNDAKLSDVRLKNIGFVFQSFHLLPRQTALDNVALPLLYAGVSKKERNKIAYAALERVGLADRTDFKPSQLSGGQCQRVAIARSIVNNPQILLADEPTGALDTASGEQIMELFKKLNSEGVTVVMITHEHQIAKQAQRILYIRDGRFVDENGKFISELPEEDISAPREFADETINTEKLIDIGSVITNDNGSETDDNAAAKKAKRRFKKKDKENSDEISDISDVNLNTPYTPNRFKSKNPISSSKRKSSPFTDDSEGEKI